MKTHRNGNGNGLDDLWILPETVRQSEKLREYMDSKGISYTWFKSNIKGQFWYGKMCVEIPFGECYKEEIDKL